MGDFWNFTDSSASLGNGVKGRSMAKAFGYVDYAMENYELEELEEMYGHELASYDDLYFPAGIPRQKCILWVLRPVFK